MKCAEIIELFDPTYMTSMIDLIAIGVETSRIDSWCSLEKEWIESPTCNIP